jgi:cyclopropane fatty-acyl-phospholipid synthase-like methyltransferase
VTYQGAIYEKYASISGLAHPLSSKYESLKHNFTRLLHPLRQGGRVLEIGPGQGELLTLCRELGVDAEGIDVSPELVASCTSRGLRVRCIDELESFLMTADPVWDAVAMVDVLEHFSKSDAYRLLSQIRSNVLRPGGRILLQVPNMQSLFGPLNLYHDFTHEWAYTEKSIEQLLRAVGYRNVETWPANFPDRGLYLVRGMLRRILYAFIRAILIVDQPNRGHILTPNFIAVAQT